MCSTLLLTAGGGWKTNCEIRRPQLTVFTIRSVTWNYVDELQRRVQTLEALAQPGADGDVAVSQNHATNSAAHDTTDDSTALSLLQYVHHEFGLAMVHSAFGIAADNFKAPLHLSVQIDSHRPRIMNNMRQSH